MAELLFTKMGAVLDLIAPGFSYAEIARRLGIDPKTIFNWITRSRNADPKLEIEWGGVVAQFEQHRKTAMAMAVAHLEAEAKQVSIHGYDEEVIFGGQQCWRLDPRMIGLSDSECDLLFGTHDRYLRDAEGNAIPLTVKRKPSDAGIALMLKAQLASIYGDKSRLDVNMNVGVMKIPRPGDPADAKVIDNSPATFTAAEAIERKDVPQIAIGRPAKDSAELAEWHKSGVLKQSEVEFVANDGSAVVIGPEGTKPRTPAMPDTTILPGDTELVADLKRELAAQLARNKATEGKPPKMPPRIDAMPARDPEGDIERSGPGNAPAESAPAPASAPVDIEAMVSTYRAQAETELQAGRIPPIKTRQIIQCADDLLRNPLDIESRRSLFGLLGLAYINRDHVGSGTIKPKDGIGVVTDKPWQPPQRKLPGMERVSIKK